MQVLLFNRNKQVGKIIQGCIFVEVLGSILLLGICFTGTCTLGLEQSFSWFPATSAMIDLNICNDSAMIFYVSSAMIDFVTSTMIDYVTSAMIDYVTSAMIDYVTI